MINPWTYNELVTCRETLSIPLKITIIKIIDKPVTEKKLLNLQENQVITYQQLYHTKLSHQIRVSWHTLQIGSCEEQINDMTGLFYTEHNKRHLSVVAYCICQLCHY